MMEIKAKTRKWGNSIGVLIPKEVVKNENLKVNQELTLIISKKKVARGKDIWGTLKFNDSTEKIMREIDRDFNMGY